MRPPQAVNCCKPTRDRSHRLYSGEHGNAAFTKQAGGLHESVGFWPNGFPGRVPPVAESRQKIRILCVCLKISDSRRPSLVYSVKSPCRAGNTGRAARHGGDLDN